MTDNPNEPRIYDAVKGGQSPPPVSAAILGGLEGVKLMLASSSDEARIAALGDALKYGQAGEDLVFEIVRTETSQVQWTAYDLLWERADENEKLQLLRYSPLRSEVGVDYTRLRDLLAKGEWKEADLETGKVMLKALCRESSSWLDIDSMEKFPCSDLHTIDQLWVKYSGGHFGFSVQKRIWENVGGLPGQLDYEIYNKFGARVGWFVKYGHNWLWWKNLNFTLDAPQGHLPLLRLLGLTTLVIRVSFLSLRLVNCSTIR